MASSNGSSPRLLVPAALAVGIVGGAFTLGQIIGVEQGGSTALKQQVQRLDKDQAHLENKVAEHEQAISILEYRLQANLPGDTASERVDQ